MANKTVSESANREAVRQKRVAFTLLFLLAIILRLYAVIQFPANQVADAADYHRLAINLAASHKYVAQDGSPTAWRPPGYPFFLAAIYSVAGVNIFVACLVQAVLGGFTVMAVMYLALQIFDQKIAIVSGVIAALYPGLFYLPRRLLSENLAVLLLLLSLCLTVRIMRSDELWPQLLLGTLLGLCILTRGANVIAAILLLGLVSLKKLQANGYSSAFRSIFLAALTMAFVLTPWALRNYKVFHRFVPLATQDGITLYGSYWPPVVGSKRIWGNLPGEEDPVVAVAFKSGDEVAVSDSLKKATYKRLIAEPSYFFTLWPYKLLSLLAPFDWETFPHSYGSTRSFNWGYFFILLPAALGAWTTFRVSISQTITLLALPASTLIQSLIFYGSPRFRLSAEPIAILMAAAGIVWLTGIIFNTTGKNSFGLYDSAKFED